VPGRIGRALERTATEGRLAFVPFLTSGFPDLAESDRLLAALCEEGADLLELGVPFSDPLADGPVIQESTRVALEKGVRLADTLGQARRLRAAFETPLVVMTYLNPVLAYGAERFARDAVAAGVDGLIVPDMPPDEAGPLKVPADAVGLSLIFLLAPKRSSCSSVFG